MFGYFTKKQTEVEAKLEAQINALKQSYADLQTRFNTLEDTLNYHRANYFAEFNETFAEIFTRLSKLDTPTKTRANARTALQKVAKKK